MTVFCTYCSAEKDRSERDLPAIQRYRDSRIQAVFNAAKGLGIPFLILSGKFGLLEPGDPIPHYDHLLQFTEIPAHADLVAAQLRTRGVKDIIFFTMPETEDKNIRPYCETIKIAAKKTGIELKFVYLPPNR